MEAGGADRAGDGAHAFQRPLRPGRSRRSRSRPIQRANLSPSKRALPRRVAAKVLPMSGRRVSSPGSTKRRKRNLDDALVQLVRYAAALENPPLQVACDTDRFLIRTAWTREVPKTYEFALDDLADPQEPRHPPLGFLRSGQAAPKGDARRRHQGGRGQVLDYRFAPARPRFAGEVAHFVNQLVFCFFAHSVKLLPNGFFPDVC